VGIAALGSRPLSLDAALRAAPELAARVRDRPTASAVMGAGPLLQRTTGRVRGRVLLVGDAAGYVDALTGEGLRLGFAQAESAVRAVVAGDTAAYAREWRRLTRSYRVLTHGLLAAASSPVSRRGIVPTAASVPWAFGRIVDALGG
jgi:flavin-dependent dehydrogenase